MKTGHASYTNCFYIWIARDVECLWQSPAIATTYVIALNTKLMKPHRTLTVRAIIISHCFLKMLYLTQQARLVNCYGSPCRLFTLSLYTPHSMNINTLVMYIAAIATTACEKVYACTLVIVFSEHVHATTMHNNNICITRWSYQTDINTFMQKYSIKKV